MFFGAAAAQTELAVRTIESELRAFREKNKVLALKQQTDALVQNIDRVDTEIDNARIQLDEVSQQIKALQGQLGMTSKAAAEATSLSSSTMVQQLLTELQSVQRELDQARSRFQETHPIVQGLRDQERALQSRLQTSSGQISPDLSATSLKNLQLSALDQQLTAELVKLEVEQAGLLTRVDGLSQVRQQQVGQSQSIPLLEQTQRALERRLEAAQTTYSLVLQRLQEIQIAENQTIGNVRVIAQATLPDKPDSTDKKLLLLGGLTLGLLGGTAAALFADLLDGSVKTAEEAADLLGYGLLGVIPSGRSSSGPAQLRPFELDSSSDQHALQISSAYSNLQANVRLLSATQEPKTLMITASSRREGTSGVVANFAASIADSSSKVLIIDANLESSAQAEIWQCSSANGLLDVLSSRASLHAAIQDITPFLSVLPMNRLNQRPLTMLDFKKIEVIVHDLRKQFDFVVIDAPCLSDSVDASVLGTLVDGILVVVKPQVAKKNDILAAKRRLEHADRKVLGVVANELKVSDPRSSVSLYSPASNHPIFIQ
ncbi:MAG: polysaccharide biosynthesis tyrosine autokinase [Synechococcales cyanobacterium RU_4_20]|nr:polysaccharide biosynthesis tyrosine autokinase [Synechococcales cyanobacterium RU_4_20]